MGLVVNKAVSLTSKFMEVQENIRIRSLDCRGSNGRHGCEWACNVCFLSMNASPLTHWDAWVDFLCGQVLRNLFDKCLGR